MAVLRKFRWGAGLAAATLVAAGVTGTGVVEQAQATADAYLFGYPLALMDLTQRYQVEHMHTPMNQLTHRRIFPDATFQVVVSPNADTLYSQVNFDLSKEPQVLSIPDMRGHYFMTPILDAWTNVFTSPGTRTLGDGPHQFLIAGPNWQGEVPENLELLRSPTNLAWMIGRLKSSGPRDYLEINQLQDQFKLQSLSRWQGKTAPASTPTPLTGAPAVIRSAPDQQLAEWPAEAFFGAVCQLMRNNPPRKADEPVIEQMRQAGLLSADCSMEQSLLQRLGTWIGYRKAVAGLEDTDRLLAKLPTYNGWRISYGIGEYGHDYRKRALIAKIGLGANLNEDAIYPALHLDNEGNPLSGANRYVLHFSKQQLPPVKGFWSLTLYDQHQFFVANPLNRFAIGDRDALHFNADGSLDLYFQHQAPSSPEQLANWLPAPEGEFNLMLRLYWPTQAALDRTWLPPTIQRLP